MSKRSSSHLRLHVETPDPVQANVPLADDVTACLDAFAQATGWAVKPHAASRSVPPRPKSPQRFGPLFAHGWELVEANPIDGITSVEELLSMPMVGLPEAESLLKSIQHLVERLDKAECAVRRQEAELAAGIAISWKGDEQDSMADRLESILSSAGSAIGTTAAALYLLDETTSELKMRACWGLPTSRLSEPARPLRGSLADLEALLGNAVMLEDIAISPEWHSPEQFGSAICVPIGSPTMPHGTMWFWSEQPRTFNAAEVEIANMSAGRMMSELERTVLGNELQSNKIIRKQLDEAGLAQASRLPSSQPLHADFQVDGWTFQDGSLGGGFHDWDVNPKGNMVFALGQANRTGPAGAIVAASAHSIVRSNWPNNIAPLPIMRSLNDVLFGCLESDWRASACVLQINPETFHGSLCNAGSTQAFIVSQRGYRPLGTPGPLLAAQPDPTFLTQRFILQPGEVLVAFSASVVHLPNGKISKQKQQQALSQDQLLQSVYQMLDDDATDIAGHLARLLPTVVTKDHTGVDRSLLVIRNVRKP